MSETERIINETVAAHGRTMQAIEKLSAAGKEVCAAARVIDQRENSDLPIEPELWTAFCAALKRQIVQLDALSENAAIASEASARLLSVSRREADGG